MFYFLSNSHLHNFYLQQIDKAQFEKIKAYIKIGKEQGATLMCGGQRHGDKGYFIQPTVFADVEDHMTIAKEEVIPNTPYKYFMITIAVNK